MRRPNGTNHRLQDAVCLREGYLVFADPTPFPLGHRGSDWSHGRGVGAGVGGRRSTSDPTDRDFATQNVLANGYGAVQLSKGVTPATGRIWQVRRVFWNVNFYGTVANGVQTYLYRLPSSLTRAQAMAHMASSLDGWLGCCGNSQLTGNGDMTFGPNEVLIRPRQLLWISVPHSGFLQRLLHGGRHVRPGAAGVVRPPTRCREASRTTAAGAEAPPEVGRSAALKPRERARTLRAWVTSAIRPIRHLAPSYGCHPRIGRALR